MKHRYMPMTETDRAEMLKVIGVSSVDELFADIPEKVRYYSINFCISLFLIFHQYLNI